MIKIKNKNLLSVLMMILLFISAKSKADDGTFLSSGDELFPLQETTVELRHEILRFHYNEKEDRMEVDVMFEFYNPGPKKNLLVGFVTPADSRYVFMEDSAASKPYIHNLIISKDNQVLPYKCTLHDNSKSYDGYDSVYKDVGRIFWAYTFQVTFDTGYNVIHHTYSYDGDISNDGVRDFPYRLSTGSLWANREIGKLELYIDAGVNELFAVPLAFDSRAYNPLNWEIVGLIKSHIDTTNAEINECIQSLYCYSKGGYLHLSREHVKASIDLNIALLDAPLFSQENQEWFKMSWFIIPELNDYPGCSPPIDSKLLKMFGYKCTDTINGSDNLDEDSKYQIAQLNLHQLTILKNIPFALAGYDFKNSELKAYFNQFIWYFPDPNVPDSYDILTPTQRKLVDYVTEQIKLLAKK